MNVFKLMNIEIRDKTAAESFCNIFQHVKIFSDHINITFNDEQLYVQSMDSSHIVIFEIHLPKDWFDLYDKKSDGDIVVGIHAGVFSKVLQTRGKTQQIKLEYLEDTSDKLYVYFADLADDADNSLSSLHKHFQLPLMDIESEMLAIPDFDSDVEITMTSAGMSSIISQLQIFGDSMDFICSDKDDKIQVVTQSIEAGKMEVDIINSPQTECEINEGVDMKVSFALYRMHDICSNTKVSKKVQISISNCYPIRIKYDVGDGGKLLFYLAPKVDES